MVRAQRVVDHGLRDGQMELAFLRCRGEQWVRCAHAPTVDQQQPGISSLLHDLRADNRCQLVNPQLCPQRNRQQQPAQLGCESTHARAEQLLNALRHRDVISRPRHPLLAQRPANLENEQGIPKRRGHDATQHLPGQHQPEPIRQQPTRRAETELTDLQGRSAPHDPSARSIADARPGRLASSNPIGAPCSRHRHRGRALSRPPPPERRPRARQCDAPRRRVRSSRSES